MTEKPILFSGAMVRALLDGRKTQTRRPVTALNHCGKITGFDIEPASGWKFSKGALRGDVTTAKLFEWCPYGQPGDRLWVRETFTLDDNGHEEWPVFRADGAQLPKRPAGWEPKRWIPSIHMPRWASRIVLEVNSVRVERLQEISEADARAEGAYWSDGFPDDRRLATSLVVEARDEYRHLWDSLNAARGYGWDVNPWVWVVEFKRVKP